MEIETSGTEAEEQEKAELRYWTDPSQVRVGYDQGTAVM